MSEETERLRERARTFAVRVLKFVRTLPRDAAGITIAHQLARAGSGVSGNYQSEGRARSRAEFIARLGTTVDEADESLNWLTIIKQGGLQIGIELEWLLDESGQLLKIFSASLATAKRNHRRHE